MDLNLNMTSAEPSRRKPYSVDIRWRVVWQRIGMDLSFRSIACRLNISVGTAYNIFKLFELTGSVEAKSARKRPELCKLGDHHILYVIGLVLYNPSVYLSEMCSAIKDTIGTEVSPSTLCKLLAQHGFTQQKIQCVARQRSLKHRAAFIADISYFPKEMLVWVDETGCDKRDTLRKFG